MSAETVNASPGQGEKEDRFEKLVSILIATITILAAVTASLQAYASTQAGQANRRAQEMSILATTTRLSGVVRFSHEWQGAYQNWSEVDLQITSAEQSGDAAAAERYRQLRDRLTGGSTLLQAPYFAPTANSLDTARYEAETYLVEATKLSERFAAQAALGNGWDGIANAFVVQLTLLAVSLSLYGLATTISSWVRWLFVGVGSAIAIFCLLWMGVSLIWPLPETPEAAIEAYAEGVGLAYQEKDEEAIASFDKALGLKTDYANAFYERGNSYYNLGDFEKAAADYVAAREAGKDDVNVGWNLGWTYYLLGRFDEAVRVDEHTLELDPTLIGVRLNLAVAKLAQGKYDEARAEYDKTLNEAVRQVTEARAAGKEPASSLWFYLDYGAFDIDNLLFQMDGVPRPWTEAPPVEAVSADLAEMRAVAEEQQKRIKEMTVSLEYSGQPPAGPTSANASDFQFGQEVYDDQGNFVDYQLADTFPYGTNDMVILFDYAGMQDGQQQIWKIYVNGVEDPTLRVVSVWDLGESGSAAKTISYAYSNVYIFAPGEYAVELYIDSELIKRGTFYVEEQ
jgi:tetratricopeptide (TPR) repeat protein